MIYTISLFPYTLKYDAFVAYFDHHMYSFSISFCHFVALYCCVDEFNECRCLIDKW